uniref:Uncharacterized protein n=1 Tax=Rhizophora mucronata TaxID=61149 RepID=A0A2P2P2D9_RHIMU
MYFSFSFFSVSFMKLLFSYYYGIYLEKLSTDCLHLLMTSHFLCLESTMFQVIEQKSKQI